MIGKQTKGCIGLNDEAKRTGRPSYWPDEFVVKMDYKAPKSLRDKLEKKVEELKKQGVPAKIANKSNIQRIIVEKAIDDVQEFFDQELVTRK